MELYPLKLRIEHETDLVIVWNDEREQTLSIKLLRTRCPCSVCRKQPDEPAIKPNSLNVLSDSDLVPLRIESMHPVGNYAYSIHFSDGHSSGIFSFEYLRRLSD
jgi:DUF971 family protein